MFVTGFLLSYLLAVGLTLILAVGLRGQGWGKRIVLFFLVVLLATWAGGLWLPAVGPLMLEVPWLTSVMVALTAGLVMTAVMPRGGRRGGSDEATTLAARADATAALDIVSWTLISGFSMAIALRYFLALE